MRYRLMRHGKWLIEERRLLAACVAALWMIVPCASAQDTTTREAAIENIEAALRGLPENAESVKLSVGNLDVPPGGHLQGIQLRHDAMRDREIAFLSHDSQTLAYFVVAEFPPGLTAPGRVTHVHKFPSDGQAPPLRHAGGFQIAGDILAIGLEDNQLKTRSEVQFWNIADAAKPTQLGHLTIRRRGEPKEQTAGAVALAAQAKDHLVAVANWDSRAIDFYVSNGQPLADSTCRFTHLTQCRADAADSNAWRPDQKFGTYQAINFVTGGDNNLYLLAFNTEPAGTDVVDLFAVTIGEKPPRMLRKIASRPFKLAGGSHFRFAGGASILGGRLTILASPSQLTGEMQLSVAK
jgi:hypothetical protein